jgi:hypothetical protein
MAGRESIHRSLSPQQCGPRGVWTVDTSTGALPFATAIISAVTDIFSPADVGCDIGQSSSAGPLGRPATQSPTATVGPSWMRRRKIVRNRIRMTLAAPAGKCKALR